MPEAGRASTFRTREVFVACLLAVAPAEAVAQQCSGGLFYLGNTKDSSQSVWLSGVPAGSFRLDAAQGNQTVDAWLMGSRGLHLSLSPVVSKGNGGTHKLYNTGGSHDCLIATQNQKGGLPDDFPDIDPRPPTPPTPPTPTPPTPPAPLPPIDHFFPEFGGSRLGIGALPSAEPTQACVDPQIARRMRARGLTPRICREGERARRSGDEVPLTPGRDLGARALWNVWTQTNYIGFADHRYGLDVDGRVANLNVGIDRQINNNFIAGMLVTLQASRSSGFDDFLKLDTNGFNVGPYIAARLSEHWAIDATLTYGYARTELDIVTLSGNSKPTTIAGSVNLHGQYRLGEFRVRPKFSVYYARVHNDAFDVAGTISGTPVIVTLGESDLDYGLLEATTEISRIFEIGAGRFVMPYVELGGRYAFERPNDGAILTGDLTFATPTEWSGSVRSGFRMSLSDTAIMEASAGYLSLGQNGLDVWEGRLRFSVGF